MTLPASPRGHLSLSLERLEDRLALSWAATPPALIPPPAGAVAVTLNGAASATGPAAITANENDFYTFVAPWAGSYRFDASTPSSNLDTVLGIYSAAGSRLAFNDDIAPGNRDSRVSVALTAGQRYYFGISNFTGTPGGSYTWQVTGPALVDDASENNDTQATASNLGTVTGQRTVSGLVMADTQDWFRFATRATATSGHSVALAFSHLLGDLVLRLYDSAGTLVRTSDGDTNGESVSLAGLPAGTYFIQAYGYQGAFNPAYSLKLVTPTGPPPPASRVLYLNFDGAAISRAQLTRWAGTDWPDAVTLFDADGNGVSVQRFLAARGDREQIITRLLQFVQEDLRPFGLEVRRTTSLAVENQGATTIFLGRSTLTNDLDHVAADVDMGNDNRTDIAFVGDEDWGTAERTAVALADVTLHEAGHTYGLWHVNSGTALESMGLRYSVTDQTRWSQNTSFLDRTFPAFVGSDGVPHGPGPQNSYRAMLAAFGGNAAAPPGGPGAAPAGGGLQQPGAEAVARRSGACGCPLCRGAAGSRSAVLAVHSAPVGQPGGFQGRSVESLSLLDAVMAQLATQRRDQVRAWLLP